MPSRDNMTRVHISSLGPQAGTLTIFGLSSILNIKKHRVIKVRHLGQAVQVRRLEKEALPQEKKARYCS